MHYAFLRTFLAVLFGFVLAATGVWASPAGEEEPVAALEKEMVTDPTTGKMVTAPEYGGTLTLPYVLVGDTTDPFVTGHYAGFLIDGVNEQLAYGDWGIDRQEFDFRNPYLPVFAFTGAELPHSKSTRTETDASSKNPLERRGHCRAGGRRRWGSP